MHSKSHTHQRKAVFFFASSRKNSQSSSSAQPQTPGENQWQLQHVKASKSMDLGTAPNQQPTGGESLLSLCSACWLHASSASQLKSKACLGAPMHLQPAGTDFCYGTEVLGGIRMSEFVLLTFLQKNSEYAVKCFFSVMEEGVLGLASPGKHAEEHVNTSGATTSFDPQPPAAFLFLLCQIIGPQFVSKAFNCCWVQRAAEAASCSPQQLRHPLLSDVKPQRWGFSHVSTVGRKSASEKKRRRRKVFVSLAGAGACIHSGCCSATKAHCLKCHFPQPSLSHKCVSERKWDKGAGHSLSRHFTVNKGLLLCTSVRYPAFVFGKPPLDSFDASLWLEWCDVISGAKHQTAGGSLTTCLFVLLTVEGHDFSKHSFVLNARSLLLLEQMFSPLRVLQPFQIHSALSLLPSMPSVSGRLRRAAWSASQTGKHISSSSFFWYGTFSTACCLQLPVKMQIRCQSVIMTRPQCSPLAASSCRQL